MPTVGCERKGARLWTARVTYAGADRLDVTRKSAGPDGLPFAPSWQILGPMLKLRRNHGVATERSFWPRYIEDYTAEMRVSYRDHRPSWDRLLARDEVTLVCYCTDPTYCHRTLLAGILGKLGADVRGERPPDADRLLRAMMTAAEFDQTTEEAESELRDDGVDVDAFVDSVSAAIALVVS